MNETALSRPHMEILELGGAHEAGESGHWRLTTDSDDIAWLVLDKTESSANVLSAAVIGELDEKISALEKKRPKGLVIRSAKTSGFIAGADIGEFGGMAEAGKAAEMLEKGHAVLDRLEALPFPTIAVVHGYALGGGFELALACDYRIAVEGASFGFPEVQLGLHPGLGGTFRLTDLIDPVEAMTMMLTGRTAHTKKARTLGIADLVTKERHVRAAVKSAVDGKIDEQRPGLKNRAFSLRVARSYAARQMRAKTAEKAPKADYPAPHALIDLWEEHGGDRQAMQTAEIASFARLLETDTARNLIRVYFLREALKRGGGGDCDIARVHVAGAGAMGGDIAAWCAINGFTVSLFDPDTAALGRAVASAGKMCEGAHLNAIATRDALDRLVPDPKGRGVEAADLVIEAGPESRDVKTAIYSELEPRMKTGAILATNTSSIGLDTLAKGLSAPQRFAGLHFFNPVAKMQLVEVVHHDATDNAIDTRLRAFTGAIGRLPAPVKSYPGFLVNRALTPYLLEAIALLDEGFDKETIDRAAERFGMPMGPLELADQVGLDICLHVGESLRADLANAFPDPPRWLKEKVERGELGRKTGKGFYPWKDGKAQKSDSEAEPPKDMTDRLVLPMLDACVECLREGVADDADVVDGAMIFATGFAPFRGGPIAYARSRGVNEIVEALKGFAARHGPRFQPDAGWSDIR